MKVQKRDGAIVPFDVEKIVETIQNAFLRDGCPENQALKSESEELAGMIADNVMANDSDLVTTTDIYLEMKTMLEGQGINL